MLLMLLCVFSADAQKKARKAPVIQVTSVLVDESGAPVEDALILAGEGSIASWSAADGSFTIMSRSDAIILIEAEGYGDVTVNLKAGSMPEKITLRSERLYKNQKDLRDRMDGGKMYHRELTSAIESVDVNNLKRYSDLSLSNAMQGLSSGVVARATTGGLGYNPSNLNIRGPHAAIVVIDGIERSMDDIMPEEIESMEILKDASAKILYGPRATNGVILITTKRGEPNKKIIRASLEYGVTPVTRNPEFLGSYDYASLYNEARRNDGLDDYYLPYQLEGYRNTTGENDLLYPEHDWYDRFTRKSGTYRKASAEFYGGNQNVSYSLVFGYTGGDGLEKVGKRSTLNRLNVRGNLDIRINDFLTVAADVAGRLETKAWSGKNGSGLYSSLSTYRPNEYPFIMDADAIGMTPKEDGTPYYGASALHTDNLLSEMEYGGDKDEKYVNSQTNFGVKFDFDKYVKGLFADAYITFDNYNYVNRGISRNYETYGINSYLDEYGIEQMVVTQYRKLNQSDDIKVSSETTTRKIGWRANVGYKTSFGRNNLAVNGSFRYYKDEVEGANQDCVTSNATLRLNYDYNSRFLAEAVIGLAGSNQFAKNNRYLLTGSIGLGYIFSEEPFVKARLSAGRLGHNPNANYLLYRTSWLNGATYALGNNNNTSVHITNLGRWGNPYIDWIVQNEANIGVEGLFFGRRLSLAVDGFVYSRENQITSLSTNYSDLVGNYLRSVNYGSTLNWGAELAANWNGKAAGGDFRYTVGVNFLYSQNMVTKANELSNIEGYRKTVGKPTSAIFGLESLGLFGRDVDLENHPKQMFGSYTTGDVAYKDLNRDGVVDDKDETQIGQTFPIGVLGINLDLNYKGFGLYILGTAELGASVVLNNNYYWNTGTNSYSVKALDRWHPENNPEGTLPRLTTTSGTNSYRTSDFWVSKADWFRLKNVELSYTFDNRNSMKVFKTLKVFARGTNLLVFSPIKDLDPEVPNAGLVNYPVCRTITGGITIGF